MEQLPLPDEQRFATTQQELIDRVQATIDEYESADLLDGEEINLYAAYRLRERLTGQTPPENYTD